MLETDFIERQGELLREMTLRRRDANLAEPREYFHVG